MTSDKKSVEITGENFETAVLRSERPVVVDFWAAWCGPCHAVAPAVEQLAEDFDGKATVGKVNVDEQPDLAAQYQVQSIPTLLFFKGGQIVDRAIGVVPKHVLSSKLSALLAA